MALPATQVGQAGAQCAAPGDGAAVVAGMAGKDGAAHLGQLRRHHLRIAAKAVAGQQQGAAGQGFGAAVRAQITQAQHPALRVAVQLAHQGIGQQHRAGLGGCRLQRGHQRRAGALRQRVHAAQAVAGVEKAVQQLKAQAVALLQRVHGRADGLRVGGCQLGGSAASGLGLDVGGKARGRIVVNTRRPLHRRASRRDEARRQRGGALGAGIAFEQHAINAGVAQHHCSGQPAGAGTDDGHRHLGRVGRQGCGANDAGLGHGLAHGLGLGAINPAGAGTARAVCRSPGRPQRSSCRAGRWRPPGPTSPGPRRGCSPGWTANRRRR